MKRTLAALLAIASSTLVLHAAEISPAETKLRETLKNTLLQLRDAQTAKAALEVAKAELEQNVQTLTEKSEAMTKQLADEKAAAEKRITEQTERLVERGNAVMKLEGELATAQKAQQAAAALATKKEAERARVTSEKIVLERKVADQQVKNAEMFKIANEILTRYEKFGLGTAIAAREPFVGLTRIKLKNQIQELGDKLADQKLKP